MKAKKNNRFSLLVYRLALLTSYLRTADNFSQKFLLHYTNQSTKLAA